jgi:creatine kinase
MAEEPPMEEDQDLAEFPGLGDEEYPGFPAGEVPEECPDITKHFSIMTDVLKRQPELYSKLRDKKTYLGVSLGKCIKTGIDNKGHPMIKTVGMVAGDEESYETFSELFDPVISVRHEGYAADAKHPTNLDCSKLTSTRCDPSGKYVFSAQVRTARSLRGLRLPPAMSQDEPAKPSESVSKPSYS